MLTQPISQQRLTNVALIKYKLHNKKFEIACYKNKAINWRNGIEKDLDEVLQSDGIFTNASQGLMASEKELKTFFPGLSHKDIIKIILNNGELQISDKERDNNLETIAKEITNIITEKCVHSLSKRPISIDSVQQAIKDIHFPIKIDQPPKRQALTCIKKLQRKFLLSRAEMKIQITCTTEKFEKLTLELEKIEINKDSSVFEKTEKGDEMRIKLLIEPSKYRAIDSILKTIVKDGIVEVLVPYVANREITDIETAGTVNLEIKPDYKEGDEFLSLSSDSENEHEHEKEPIQKSGNAKKGKKAKRKEILKKKEIEEQMNSSKQAAQKSKLPEEKEEEKTNYNFETKDPDKKEFKCTSCKSAHFENNIDYRTHFKTKWHVFNLKRKCEKLESLTEEEYKINELDKEFNKK